MPNYRVLGLTAGATRAQIKVAYLALAKQWHPDLHHGDPKAEEKFKAIQQAYDALTGRSPPEEQPQQSYYNESAARQRRYGGTARGPAGAGGHNWGSGAEFGQAGKAGYDPHESYMGFGRGNSHWYEDVAAAARRTEQRNSWRMMISAGLFFFGLWSVQRSGARDQAAKDRGELVDAWYNQTTRRWEPPKPHMYKDPLLSALIHLKPPHMVYKGMAAARGSAAPRKKDRTLDGLTGEQAYRARQQGTR